MRLPDKPIFLTGFMATGKSKVGRILAERLGRAFVDTDDLVVEAAGKSIPDIFAQDGEPVFRQLEHEAIQRASQMPCAIISLGGGAVTQERNWDVIRASGVCLCFRASVETIYERVSRKRDERPLLAGLDDDGLRQRIKEMLEKRAPFYNRADAFVTSSDEYSPEDMAEVALDALKEVFEKAG